MAAERPVPEYEERSVRAAVGALIERSGDKHADAARPYREALRKAAIAGARVQQEAHRLTADIETEVDEMVKGLARVRKLALKWRRVTCEGGPARVAALRHVREAEVRAYAAIVQLAEGGSCSAEEAEAMVADEVEMRARAAHREARAAFPPRGLEAYADWRWLWRLTR